MKKLNREKLQTIVNEVNEPLYKRFVCDNHTKGDKMENMISCSSSCTNNAYCRKMSQIKGTVCEKCYSQKTMNCRKAMKSKYEEATEILKTSILSDYDLPTFNAKVARIEAFGELNNTIQAINYINIIRKNPDVNFGWWTKRPNLIARALKEMNIDFPENCNVVYSNPYIDVLPKIQKYSFINGYFTVWTTKEKATENGCKINCGSMKCFHCLECYDYHDGVFFINELLK